MRLEAATMLGIQNPYFHVARGHRAQHDGDRRPRARELQLATTTSGSRATSACSTAVDRGDPTLRHERVARAAWPRASGPFHRELEAELAKAQGVEDSLVFTAGHATNVTTIGHLFGPGRPHPPRRADPRLRAPGHQALRRRPARRSVTTTRSRSRSCSRSCARTSQKCLIIVEGVYSMDGDICDLPEYVALKKQYGCLLLVDEAHSFGVAGAPAAASASTSGVSPARRRRPLDGHALEVALELRRVHRRPGAADPLPALHRAGLRLLRRASRPRTASRPSPRSG